MSYSNSGKSVFVQEEYTALNDMCWTIRSGQCSSRNTPAWFLGPSQCMLTMKQLGNIMKQFVKNMWSWWWGLCMNEWEWESNEVDVNNAHDQIDYILFYLAYKLNKI